MSPRPEAGDAPARRLSARGLTKRFGSFTANDGVDLELVPGTVHVLLGENGAGKSTFMNMLYGHLEPDEGSIELDGKAVPITSPGVALEHGIGMVHQHFSLVPSYSVAANVVLGVEPQSVGYSRARVSKEVRATVDRLGWDFDVDRRVEDLPVSAQQRVEILKLLHRGARILLLDEPTALLTPTEIESLLETIVALRDSGAAILLVTHKLKEVESVADSITVIRHGVVTGHFSRGEASQVELARAMTGRASIPEVRTTGPAPSESEIVLEVDGLTVGRAGAPAVDAISFAVRSGEILGIAAVEGNGQHELVEAMCGLAKVEAGRVVVRGADVTGATPRQVRAAGVAVIPADRREQGVVGDMSLAENFSLNAVAAGGRRRRGLLDRRRMRQLVTEAVAAFDIRPGRVDARAGSLSGGNMQKLVIARELSADPALVLAVSPTWGLDIGAVADVRERLVGLRSAGCAIVLSSPDLDEVIDLSDRIIVLYRGAVVAQFDRETLDTDALAVALMGVTAA
ncbi:ABC transporter ATP-binding protein [Herbiconiux sp. VKM Ac-2851]|uniref:ABC transporter ATP-binding protein n=1 Tax=Herbiconiux sp. VKM Ac-2851 TaxID=2739025 RepID=UPI001564FE01|nr:ABC transporter ATP-binding protein [Herbiconiux sp. VKM Ac-2851]NQX35110.1 ABC transporter ATP-binding protein [Herbiconiux sp. VKM Ac-2851]